MLPTVIALRRHVNILVLPISTKVAGLALLLRQKQSESFGKFGELLDIRLFEIHVRDSKQLNLVLAIRNMRNTKGRHRDVLEKGARD